MGTILLRVVMFSVLILFSFGAINFFSDRGVVMRMDAVIMLLCIIAFCLAAKVDWEDLD